MFKTGEHNHSTQQQPDRVWGIAKNVQEFIREAVSEDKKLKTLTQVSNFCARVRERAQSAFEKENIGELVKWVSNHTYTPQLADDEAFVLPGAVLPEDLSWEGNADVCIVFSISTKKLLNNAVLQQHSNMPTICCSDATYDLLCNKWPVLAMGTLDWNHKFRTVSIGVSSHQDQDAFEAFFLLQRRQLSNLSTA